MELWQSIILSSWAPVFAWFFGLTLISLFTGYAIKHLINLWLTRVKQPQISVKKTWRIVLLILFLTSYIIIPQLASVRSSQWQNNIQAVLKISLVVASVLVLDQMIKLFTDYVNRKYRLEVADNLRHRKIITRYQFLRRITIGIIIFVAAGIILIDFESMERFGTSLLASAGVLSVVVGFAAQKSLGNLIAGFQIAFTQPIRIDDAVVVENEWGWIEEITMTYVVVRIWDRRRLILPIQYFIENPVQNWTRKSSQILGSVVLYLDYRAPIDKIRKSFEDIIQTSRHWDHDVKVLQVIDTSEKTIVVRALMTGRDSPTTWDLRCEIREKLIEAIQKEWPEALPISRHELKTKGDDHDMLPGADVSNRM